MRAKYNKGGRTALYDLMKKYENGGVHNGDPKKPTHPVRVEDDPVINILGRSGTQEPGLGERPAQGEDYLVMMDGMPTNLTSKQVFEYLKGSGYNEEDARKEMRRIHEKKDGTATTTAEAKANEQQVINDIARFKAGAPLETLKSIGGGNIPMREDQIEQALGYALANARSGGTSIASGSVRSQTPRQGLSQNLAGTGFPRAITSSPSGAANVVNEASEGELAKRLLMGLGSYGNKDM